MLVHAYAAKAANAKLEAFEYELGAIGPDDVDIKVSHCGVCHSDLSMIDNEWQMTAYPIVPGHEVVGTVAAVGAHVKTVKVGQRVGLGWQCGSCAACEFCRRGKEHVCAEQKGTIIAHHGGWADYVRCSANFALPVPEAIASEDAGPLMCAGGTVYTPATHYGVTPGMRTAVVGIGGLGHLAIQFLNKMGCEVTAISSTRSKEAEARTLGAHDFIATSEQGALAKAARRFDYICSTASGDVAWNELVAALRPQGRLAFVGIPESELKLVGWPMIDGEKTVSGGRIGSPTDNLDMLAFAARHGIKPMRNDFAMSDVNKGVELVRSGKARYRVVLHAH